MAVVTRTKSGVVVTWGPEDAAVLLRAFMAKLAGSEGARDTKPARGAGVEMYVTPRSVPASEGVR